MTNHNGWKLVRDNWVKVGEGKGNAGYFAREIPPLRDTMNRPLRWNGKDWVIDNGRLIWEVNKGKWKNLES